MPGGTQSTSSTTSVQAPQAVNSPLNNLFTSLMTGGLGSGSAQFLQNLWSGSALSQNVSSIYNTLKQSGQQGEEQSISQIKEAAGAGGTRFSTDTTAQIGNYASNYLTQLNTTATQMGLQELGTQEGAAGAVFGTLGQAGSQYYSPGSTTKGNTSLPWTTGFTSLTSGISNLFS